MPPQRLPDRLEYAGQRIQFDRPISGFQLTQQKLAWMNQELTTGRCSPSTWGGSKDTKGLRPDQVSVGKLNNVSKAIEICRVARTVRGQRHLAGVPGDPAREQPRVGAHL